jgi:hypothetical protein
MKSQIIKGKYENYQHSDHPSVPLNNQLGVKLHDPLCTASCATIKWSHYTSTTECSK